MRADIIRRIIRAYDDPIVRAYCWVRFWILRQRFLDEEWPKVYATIQRLGLSPADLLQGGAAAPTAPWPSTPGTTKNERSDDSSN